MRGTVVKKLKDKAFLGWNKLSANLKKLFPLRMFQRAIKKSYYENGRSLKKANVNIGL